MTSEVYVLMILSKFLLKLQSRYYSRLRSSAPVIYHPALVSAAALTDEDFKALLDSVLLNFLLETKRYLLDLLRSICSPSETLGTLAVLTLAYIRV